MHAQVRLRQKTKVGMAKTGKQVQVMCMPILTAGDLICIDQVQFVVQCQDLNCTQGVQQMRVVPLAATKPPRWMLTLQNLRVDGGAQ